jgi:hypothetical protein
MRKIAIMVMAGAGALFVGTANAADIYTSSEYASSFVQPVRMVCNEDGRCYRTSRFGDAYNYGPRERYVERRRYRDWDDRPRGGIGFSAPGVSVGIGNY